MPFSVRVVRVSILLLAAGAGKRFGDQTPKVYLPLLGRSILAHCVARLAALPADKKEIILAVRDAHRKTHLAPQLEALEKLGLSKVVSGGATRQQSMQKALEAADPDSSLILIHDAARPLLPPGDAEQVLAKAAEVGAALLAIPAADTVKRVSRDNRVQETVDRRGLWLAQTPQVARRELLEEALAMAWKKELLFSDDMALIENLGHEVAVVRGSSRNLKITSLADLELAEALLRQETGRDE